MRVGEVNASFPETERDRREPAHAPAKESRALVPLTPPSAPSDPVSVYRPAVFLAHLIAMKTQQPQTRERRRAEPSDAIAAYAAAADLMKH